MKWRETRGVDLSVNFTLKSTQLTQSHAKIREVRLQSPIKGGLDRRGGFHPRVRGGWLVVMDGRKRRGSADHNLLELLGLPRPGIEARRSSADLGGPRRLGIEARRTSVKFSFFGSEMTPIKSRKHCFQQTLAKLMGKPDRNDGLISWTRRHEDTRFQRFSTKYHY